MPKINGHMICHTHWDREWYLTREQFKPKMVRLIDGILDMAQTARDCAPFMLDGQTIILEDYLAVRPEREAALREAVRAGIVSIGPWYILPDEMLVSGESHIRNYLTGRAVAERFGAAMNIGYLPDSFGHPEQMPQILSGLSMDTIVFWRGTGNHMTHTEFIWRAPHKNSRVLGVHMSQGYGNSARLSPDLGETGPRLDDMLDTLRARSTTDQLLLMNGSDHILNQPNIKDILAAYGRQAQGREIRLTTLQRFLDALKPELPALETYEGELCYGDRTVLLSGTLSSRVYLKQRNALVQRLMERYLEPLIALEKLDGREAGFGGYQRYLWKMILENHPHDSICGCSIDEVHDEMMTRFGCVEQLERALFADAMDRAARLGAPPTDGRTKLLCFEPTQDGLSAYVEVSVDLDPMLVKRVNYAKSMIEEFGADAAHPALPGSVVVTTADGRVIPSQLIECHKDQFMHLQDETLPEVYQVNRCKLGLLLPGGACGLSELFVRRAEAATAAEVPQDPDFISNETYRVSFDGEAFSVLDRRTGRTHRGVARLIDKGDAGDSYTHSWPEQDEIFTLAKDALKVSRHDVGALRQSLIVEGELALPDALSEDRKRRGAGRVRCSVRMTASLSPGIDRIDFCVEIDNRAKDHVLQVQLPTGALATHSRGSTAFALTRHETKPRVVESWMEYPFPTHACHGFIDAADANGGASVAADGLFEYEARNEDGQTLICLTLLRCVGWLSRPDLLTRVGNGGWEIPTPGAQCLGPHSFRFALSYQEAGGDGLALAERMLMPPALAQPFPNAGAGGIENALRFVSQLPPDVRLSAMKPSEDGKSVVIRVYSVSASEQLVSLRLPACVKTVRACNLAEQPEQALDLPDGMLHFPIEPGQIRSFLLS